MSQSTFELAKQRQNYLPFNQRPACHNCARVSKHSEQCMEGGFFIQQFAICAKHEPKALPTGAPA